MPATFAMNDQAVQQSIARVTELIEQMAGLSKARAPSAEITRRAVYDEMSAIQRTIAVEFGRRHGWIGAQSRFRGPAILARGSTTASSLRPGETNELEHDLFDHPYCYRAANRPFRATAIAAHLYNNSADDPGNLGVRARAMGLSLSWPDFPSWWYPGRTALALYIPANPPLRLVA